MDTATLTLSPYAHYTYTLSSCSAYTLSSRYAVRDLLSYNTIYIIDSSLCFGMTERIKVVLIYCVKCVKCVNTQTCKHARFLRTYPLCNFIYPLCISSLREASRGCYLLRCHPTLLIPCHPDT